MAKQAITTKRLAINKANAQMVAILAVASFVTVFCLFAAKSAYSLHQYQSKVTDAKEKARDQLQDNLKAYESLKNSYRKFDASPVNVIGRSSAGTGDNEGKNSKIILNALPTSYDFPALTSSLEKVLSGASLSIANITGTDDELNQQGNTSNPTPQPVDMPFSFSVKNGSYETMGNLVATLERSVRPIQIDTLTLAGGGSSMTLSVTAHTYYQPAKSLDIKKQVVK